MTQISVCFCDLCGKPYEIGIQMHNCELRATIFQKNFKMYDEIFNMCLNCLESSGLIDIFKQLRKIKEKNETKTKKMSKKYLTKELKKLTYGLK